MGGPARRSGGPVCESRSPWARSPNTRPRRSRAGAIPAGGRPHEERSVIALQPGHDTATDSRHRHPSVACLCPHAARLARAGHHVDLIRRPGKAHWGHGRPDSPGPVLLWQVRQAGQGLRHRLPGGDHCGDPGIGSPVGCGPRGPGQSRPGHRALPRVCRGVVQYRRALRPLRRSRRAGGRRTDGPAGRPDHERHPGAGHQDRHRRRSRPRSPRVWQTR